MKREGGAHRTTLSSFISLSKLISRIAVLGTPSSSASSRIFFSATIWFVSLFRERYCFGHRAKGKSRGCMGVVQHRSSARVAKSDRCRAYDDAVGACVSSRGKGGMQHRRDERKRERELSANLAPVRHPAASPARHRLSSPS